MQSRPILLSSLCAVTLMSRSALGQTQTPPPPVRTVQWSAPTCATPPVPWAVLQDAVQLELGDRSVQLLRDGNESALSASERRVRVTVAPCVAGSTTLVVQLEGPDGMQPSRVIELHDATPSQRLRVAALAIAEALREGIAPTATVAAAPTSEVVVPAMEITAEAPNPVAQNVRPPLPRAAPRPTPVTPPQLRTEPFVPRRSGLDIGAAVEMRAYLLFEGPRPTPIGPGFIPMPQQTPSLQAGPHLWLGYTGETLRFRGGATAHFSSATAPLGRLYWGHVAADAAIGFFRQSQTINGGGWVSVEAGVGWVSGASSFSEVRTTTRATFFSSVILSPELQLRVHRRFWIDIGAQIGFTIAGFEAASSATDDRVKVQGTLIGLSIGAHFSR